MNDQTSFIQLDILDYQAQKLQELVNDIIHCCEDRRIYETQKLGLPYAEAKCLMLFKDEKYLTVKGISQKLEVAKSRVTKLISGLIAKGLVESIEDPRDARVKLLYVSPRGKEKIREIEAFHRSVHKKVLLQLDEATRKDVLETLQMLQDAMEVVKVQLV